MIKPPFPTRHRRFFRKGKWPQNECRRAMMTARRHSPLHNNEPELIGYFASPLGISKSICPAGVEFKRGRTSSSHLRKQMPFALHVAANEYRIARRCPPASLPAIQSGILQEFFELLFDIQGIRDGLRNRG